MLGRRSKQATFLDADMKRRLPNSHFLKVDELIDWDPIEKRLESLYDPSNGRPSYPPLMMFKALLLQRWFNLSDRGLTEAIADRLSFQSFLGLSITDPVPDDTTFTRFRQKLQKKGLLEELFSILDSEFDRLGLLVKRGSFIDATIVQAQRRPPSKEKADKEKEEERDLDSTQIHSSAEEEDHSSHDERARAEAKDDALKITENGKTHYATDPDARWMVKRGKPYYGYKMHVKRCYNLDRFPYVGLLPNKVKAFMIVIAMNIKSAFNIIQTRKGALSSCGSA